MDIQNPPRNAGDKVFVRLGYLTAKRGLVAGARVTALGSEKNHRIEYLIRWFGAEDRPAPEEWFDSRDVADTAEAAFE